MKKIIFSIMLPAFLLYSKVMNAQYVSIPDANFVSFLSARYPAAMSGSMLDTTHSSIVNEVYLDCSGQNISNLYGIQFFDKLNYLDCSNNKLTNLPALPQKKMEILYCQNNMLSSLPVLPDSIYILKCNNNKLLTLPTLPLALKSLYCNNNLLRSLPALPARLTDMGCSYNLLTSLPILPGRLGALSCSYNDLISLPDFPEVLSRLDCTFNPHLDCLPAFHQDVFDLFVVHAGTGINCIPRHISILMAPGDGSDTLSLCNPTSGCPVLYNIAGNTHEDTTYSCYADSLNPGTPLNGIKIQKLISGIIDQQAYTNYNGNYSFDASIGDSVDIIVDTANLPVSVVCPLSNRRSVKLTITDSLFYNQNFGLKCNGMDFGVRSIAATFRKGATRPVYIKAGDLSRFFRLHCGAGAGGTVATTISGAAKYISPLPGALTPSSYSATRLTYSIADFDKVNPDSAFCIWLQIDSTAAIGGTVCISVQVSTGTTDKNPVNDSLSFCGEIVSSFDPNIKTASPVKTAHPGEWITYTIYFQNTGTDTAYHIIVSDTLDSTLDLKSFTYLASSHPVNIAIQHNVALFNFSHINLVDSLHDEANSHGWVQFRIKANSTLAPLANIKNKAAIYFDDNVPVFTNTTENINVPTSVREFSNTQRISVYPNPASAILNIRANVSGTIALYNSLGLLVHHEETTGELSQLMISGFPRGMYICRFLPVDGTEATAVRFVIQSE